MRLWCRCWLCLGLCELDLAKKWAWTQQRLWGPEPQGAGGGSPSASAGRAMERRESAGGALRGKSKCCTDSMKDWEKNFGSKRSEFTTRSQQSFRDLLLEPRKCAAPLRDPSCVAAVSATVRSPPRSLMFPPQTVARGNFAYTIIFHLLPAFRQMSANCSFCNSGDNFAVSVNTVNLLIFFFFNNSLANQSVCSVSQ